MRFIEHGPDVPERLVQLHSDGNAVFFCGAGISYPAGLPGFEGLVNQTFDGLHVTMEPAEALAIGVGATIRCSNCLNEGLTTGLASESAF